MLMAAAPICCHQFHGRSCEERRGAMFRSVRGEGERRKEREGKERGGSERVFQGESGRSRSWGEGLRGGEQCNNEMHVHTHHFTSSCLNKNNVILGIFFLFFKKKKKKNPQSGM